MKLAILLYSLLFFFLVAPMALGNEDKPDLDGHEILSRAESSDGLASVMLAQKSKRKKASREPGFRDTDPVPGNPHPVGKDKIISGIVITAVGGGVGVGLMTYAIFNPCTYYSYGTEEDYEEEKAKSEDCKKTNQILLYSGIASTALGLGIGLPRLFSGVKERKVWKQWNRDNAKRKNRSMETRTVYQYNFFLAPHSASKTLAMGINFNY